MQKLLFIDRDGVINVDLIGDYIKSPREFRFEEGVLTTLKALSDRGYQLIIISNQAGVGDGVFTEAALQEVHQHMLAQFKRHGIKIHATHYCLHGKEDGCSCRKPEIGLFQKAVEGLKYDPKATYFIGDKATDMEAGRRFGILTLFVRTGHGPQDEAKLKGKLKPDFIVDRLPDVLSILP